MNLLKMSISAAIFILVVAIVRMLLLYRLPKKAFLILWGVALCRLLIPFSITSRFNIFTIVHMLKNNFYKVDKPLTRTHILFNDAAITEVIPALPDAVPINNISSVLIIWLIGSTVCALFFLVTHFRCRREYKTALPIENEFVECWQKNHLIWRYIQIRQSDKIVAPLTYGMFRPVILLPKETDWTNETQLRYILSHEFVHIRRFDILIKLLIATALCIHWFNPLVWMMYVLANRDIELSCDETVVRTFGEPIKSAYALTLIGLEEKKSRLTPLINNFSKNSIEERIVSIMKMNRTSLIGIVMTFVVITGTTIVFATNAASTETPVHDRMVENTINTSTSYTEYKQYGLVYNKENDTLHYDGKLVRYFDDSYSLGEGISVGFTHYTATGEIDVYGVRILTDTLNADGTSNGGKLTGLRVATQEEFDQLDTTNVTPSSKAPTTFGDTDMNNGNTKSINSNLTNSSNSPIVGNSTSYSVYEQYAPYGITYEVNPANSSLTLYYEGQLVRHFEDILKTDKNGIREMRKTSTANGIVDVQAVRDADGNLTGLKVSTQEEFNQRTTDDANSDNAVSNGTAQN